MGLKDIILNNGWTPMKRTGEEGISNDGNTLITRIYNKNVGNDNFEELFIELQEYCESKNMSIEEMPEDKWNGGVLLKITKNVGDANATAQEDNIAGIVSEVVKRMLSNKNLMNAIISENNKKK